MNTSLGLLTSKQLRQAASLKEKIASLEKKLAKIMGSSGSSDSAPRRGRKKGWKMSAEARAKIAAAQKKRWAKQKGK